MLIAPKIVVGDEQLVEKIKDTRAIEFQLMEESYSKEVNRGILLARRLPKLTDICFHLPLSQCNILVVMASETLLSRLINLLENLASVHEVYGYHTQVILHGSCTLKEFEDVGGLSKLQALCSRFAGRGITILLENGTVDVGRWENNLVRTLFPTTLPMLEPCYDVCHDKISRRILGDLGVLPDSFMKAVHHIHFADAINGDGYIDKKATHGRMHWSQSEVNADLNYLVRRGVNLREARIVAEISEEDYVSRPDMFREIEMLATAALVRR